MKAHASVLLLSLAVCCVQAHAQTARKTTLHKAQPTSAQRNSGPLTWITSDFNPKTVFWIQGRFVPVNDSNYRGDAQVVTILCSVREYECLEFDGTTPVSRDEQVWVEDFKPASWDHNGILATARSIDGCTDETLKIRFSPPSVVLINSPVLPMSEGCKKVNGAWDKVLGKKGGGITAQMEQDELVPTRSLFPFADADIDFGKPPTRTRQKKP